MFVFQQDACYSTFLLQKHQSVSVFTEERLKNKKNLYCFSVSLGGLLFSGSFMIPRAPKRESLKTEKQKKIRSHFLSASVDHTLSKTCLYFSTRNHFHSVINTDNFTRLGKT